MGIGAEVSVADLEANPDPILARMRAEEPVCWVPALDMWLVTRWDDVATLEAEPDRFSAATDPSFLARALGQNMLVMDPPGHTRLQSILRPPFQPGGRSGGFVREELGPLADGLAQRITGGRFELMATYAQPLAAGALAVVLGLDEHGFDRMWAWCEGLCGDVANFENDPERTEIGRRTKEDLGAAIASRLAETGPEDQSAIGWFVQHGATTEEVINNVRLMISGGINEPRDGIGLVVWTLLSRPDLRAKVDQDPALLRRLIEEVLRIHTPVGTVTRQATTDTELGGASIKAGQLVSGILRSINLDEQHWSNPTEIDLARSEGPHAAFALGAHRCLGEWLGRQVVKVGVERMFHAFPDLVLDPDHDVEITGFEFRGPHALHVVR